MKLVAAKCPQCKADIQIDSESKQAFCMYCGTKIIIDDEVTHVQFDNMQSAGFEFEKGRQQAKDVINTNLLNEMRKELIRLTGNQTLEENNREMIDLLSIKSRLGKELSSWRYRLSYWPAIILFVFSLIISVGTKAPGWFFLGLIISAGYLFFYLVYAKRKKVIEEELADIRFAENGINAQNRKIKNQLSEIDEEMSTISIPTKYKNSDALSFFVDALESGRASTMRECINLYEQTIVDTARLAMLQREFHRGNY